MRFFKRQTDPSDKYVIWKEYELAEDGLVEVERLPAVKRVPSQREQTELDRQKRRAQIWFRLQQKEFDHREDELRAYFYGSVPTGLNGSNFRGRGSLSLHQQAKVDFERLLAS